MELSDLKQNNPRQYYDLVASGKIPYSSAGALTWGNRVTSTITEGILGGPHSPDYQSIVEPSDFATPTTLAESGRYPKPWRSAAQKLQNANYTNIGPYAALVGWSDADTICDVKNKENNVKAKRLWGRWGVATSGPNSGQGAFFMQDWYTPSEGVYNAHYFNENYEGLDPEWQLRVDWWESITKKTIFTRFQNTGTICQIEVAYQYLNIGDDGYFPGIDLSVYADYSLDLLVAMVALAAAARWL